MTEYVTHELELLDMDFVVAQTAIEVHGELETLDRTTEAKRCLELAFDWRPEFRRSYLRMFVLAILSKVEWN